jgi:ribosome-binding factor A
MIDRSSRISEEIKKEISDIIRNELKDPRIPSMVSLTNVKVTRDMRHAKIYVSIFGSDEERNNAIKALKKAVGFIRREVGHRIKIRYTPEMEFLLDNSIEEGFYLTNLIDKTVKEDDK